MSNPKAGQCPVMHGSNTKTSNPNTDWCRADEECLSLGHLATNQYWD